MARNPQFSALNGPWASARLCSAPNAPPHPFAILQYATHWKSSMLMQKPPGHIGPIDRPRPHSMAPVAPSPPPPTPHFQRGQIPRCQSVPPPDRIGRDAQAPCAPTANPNPQGPQRCAAGPILRAPRPPIASSPDSAIASPLHQSAPPSPDLQKRVGATPCGGLPWACGPSLRESAKSFPYIGSPEPSFQSWTSPHAYSIFPDTNSQRDRSM